MPFLNVVLTPHTVATTHESPLAMQDCVDRQSLGVILPASRSRIRDLKYGSISAESQLNAARLLGNAPRGQVFCPDCALYKECRDPVRRRAMLNVYEFASDKAARHGSVDHRRFMRMSAAGFLPAGR